MNDRQETVAAMPTPEGGEQTMPRLADSAEFNRFMESGWADLDRTPRLVAGAAEAAADHRRRLSLQFPKDVLAIGAGRAPVRANDTFYEFRAHSDFLWLVGAAIEGAVLVMVPTHGGHDAVLHLPVPARPGESAFFADPAHGELWVGPQPGLVEWAASLDLQTRPLATLDATIGDATRRSAAAGILTAGALTDGSFDGTTTTALGTALARLRMIKDDWEIAQLTEAVDLTVDGFAAVVSELPTAVGGLGERWLQGTFDRHARAYGNGVGYSTIVGSGKNAPTLHWVRCDGPVDPEDLLLLDMGVEARSSYTADVTRTMPASGRFTQEQRMVHDLVEAAHRRAMAAVRPGRAFSDFHIVAMEEIATGLHGWGLLPVSVDEALSPGGQHHRRYLVCGVGHHLGLDVHDCSQSDFASYQGAELEAGMVLTVEPGLYFQQNDLTVPPELRGIGVRLEDDLLVLPDGVHILSESLPISASGIEAWMQERM